MKSTAEKLWDVVIVEIRTGKVEKVIGKSMRRSTGFHNAQKRQESALKRINGKFTALIVPTGKYSEGSVYDL